MRRPTYDGSALVGSNIGSGDAGKEALDIAAARQAASKSRKSNPGQKRTAHRGVGLEAQLEGQVVRQPDPSIEGTRGQDAIRDAISPPRLVRIKNLR